MERSHEETALTPKIGRSDKKGDCFFLYVPPELVRNCAFPFRPGTVLTLDVRQDCLIIRENKGERRRVPFVEPNSPACWFIGTVSPKAIRPAR